MEYVTKLFLLIIVLVIMLMYLNTIRNQKLLETFAITPPPSIPIVNTGTIIDLLRTKYNQYESLDVPINTTDYGRNCVTWESTNNPAYSKYESNKCAKLI
jgi:hypothetical protein